MTEEQNAQIQERCRLQLMEERALAIRQLENTPSLTDAIGGGTFAAQFVFNQQTAKKLRRIDAALERIETGAYGTCERCHTPMWERLQALPYAELCFDCQRKSEPNAVYRLQFTPLPT